MSEHQLHLEVFESTIHPRYGLTNSKDYTLHINEFNRIMTMLSQHFETSSDSIVVKFGNRIQSEVIYAMIENCADFHNMYVIDDSMSEKDFQVSLKVLDIE